MRLCFDLSRLDWRFRPATKIFPWNSMHGTCGEHLILAIEWRPGTDVFEIRDISTLGDGGTNKIVATLPSLEDALQVATDAGNRVMARFIEGTS